MRAGTALGSWGYSCHCPLVSFDICKGLLFGGKKGFWPILCFNNDINFCNITGQTFIHSLDEVVLFCLCFASAFETLGTALPWQIQVFWRDLHSLPGGETPPAPGLNSLSCSAKIFCRAAMARQACPRMVPSSCASACMSGCHSATAWWWLKGRIIRFSCKHSYNTDSNVAAKFLFPCLKRLLPEKHLQNLCCILLLMTFRIMVFSDFCF